MFISSKENPTYKKLQHLASSRGRKKTGEFLIEGVRELSRALEASVKVDMVVLSQSAAEKIDVLSAIKAATTKQNTCILPDALFQKISCRENPDGVMGVAKVWACDFTCLKLKHDGLYLLVEHLEKPGNLGALMRSAEATAVDGFFIADPAVDIFNPNVIRASQGAVFSLPIYWGSSTYLLDLFQQSKLQLLATTPHTKCTYWECDMTLGSVICIGNEAFGLSDLWMQAAKKILIPMYGHSADSLNAGVSGTLCLYEARRQRQSVGKRFL